MPIPFPWSLPMSFRLRFCALPLLLAASACAPGTSDSVASGKVVSLGKQHLILQNQHDVIFLEVDEADKQNLKGLKKGENVTLLGRREVIDMGDGREKDNSEILEVVQEDGRHISLKQ